MLLHIYILSTENRSKAYLNLDDNRASLRDLTLPNLNHGAMGGGGAQWTKKGG